MIKAIAIKFFLLLLDFIRSVTFDGFFLFFSQRDFSPANENFFNAEGLFDKARGKRKKLFFEEDRKLKRSQKIYFVLKKMFEGFKNSQKRLKKRLLIQ
jgi:hypothetical protein